MLRRLSSATKTEDERKSLSLLGFTEEQISRLLLYRVRYRSGYYQRDPLVERRLAFTRWLYQQGKLSEYEALPSRGDRAVST